MKLKHHFQNYTLKRLLLEIIILTSILCLLLSTINGLLTDNKEFIEFDPEIPNAINLKLLSFNVRNEVLDKDDPDDTKHWNLRRGAVQNLLVDGDYDIIGTQEGTALQIREISTDLGNKYDHYGLGRLPSKWYGSSRDRMNEHCAIFWRNDKLQVFDYGTFWLSNEPNKMGSQYHDSPLPRIATWTIFDINDNDKYQMLVVNTHLGLTEGIRNQQLLWITRFILEVINQSIKELLIFVVGDFNEPIKGSLWNKLFKEQHARSVKVNDILTDCIVDFEKMNNKELSTDFTYHAFEGLDHAANDENHAPIDWILCSKNIFTNDDVVLNDVSIITESMSMEDKTVYPSDHFPVVLDLSLK